MFLELKVIFYFFGFDVFFFDDLYFNYVNEDDNCMS